ncbi:hypothetical protein [Nodularia sphaerocarpa]|uniref:hypothetical protein n=1 Tax=Nodularia sphaerocarpa TaxID=137816 RepID=UPI001EFC2B20|nr:hypothetical protein [Nodularia sphaerocarpa]
MKAPTTNPTKAIVISLIVIISGKESSIYPMNVAIFSLAQSAQESALTTSDRRDSSY